MEILRMARAHDKVARRIALREGARYNRGQGPDVNTTRRAVEVETAGSVRDGIRQLQGFRKPVYLAGVDSKATRAAIKATKGTTVGVMNAQGRVVRSSSRKRT